MYQLVDCKGRRDHTAPDIDRNNRMMASAS
jgi:hypothetical protein